MSKILTVCQLVDLKVLLNLPMASIRRMRTIFSNFGFKIFPSEHKMRTEMSRRVQHIEEADMKCEKILMQPSVTEDGPKEIDVMFSGNLVKYIEGVFSKVKYSFYEDPDSVVKIVLGGDKGGKSMKFHFEICHPETSVFDVHVFCMFEGADCPENLSKALEKFSSAFESMADPDFRLIFFSLWILLSRKWLQESWCGTKI